MQLHLFITEVSIACICTSIRTLGCTACVYTCIHVCDARQCKLLACREDMHLDTVLYYLTTCEGLAEESES